MRHTIIPMMLEVATLETADTQRRLSEAAAGVADPVLDLSASYEKMSFTISLTRTPGRTDQLIGWAGSREPGRPPVIALGFRRLFNHWVTSDKMLVVTADSTWPIGYTPWDKVHGVFPSDRVATMLLED